MARPGRQSQEKRFRERKKKEKRDEKIARRAERKAEKDTEDPMEGSDIVDATSIAPALLEDAAGIITPPPDSGEEEPANQPGAAPGSDSGA